MPNLPCVKTICCDCAAIGYPSAGVVARRLGMPLTEHTAALVSHAIGCLECGSKRVDVYYAHTQGGKADSKLIVRAEGFRRCRVCECPISKPFLSQFRNADFCFLCVADGKIGDSDVAAATGTLFPGEAYRLMALQFRDDEAVRVRWLRKAVDEGDVGACSTLGDLLSRSEDPNDLAEAVRLYKKAAAWQKPDPYVQRRLAEMTLQGRGIKADKEAAIELFCAAGRNGSSIALSELAKFVFNGQFGLSLDPRLAYELYCRAYEMNPKGMMVSASVAIMLLKGLGVEADSAMGAEKLRLAISIFAENKPKFDNDVCYEQVMIAAAAPEGVTLDLPVAREYLDWIGRFNVPGARPLLNLCGGPLPPNPARWELSLSKALPEKVVGHLWWVHSPVPNRLGLPSILGQIERLPDMRWIATTDAGEPVGTTFGSDGAAVRALAAVQKCDVPYTDLATRVGYPQDPAARQ